MQSRCINNLAMRAFLEGQWPLAQDRFAMAAEVLHRVGDTANEVGRLQPGRDGHPPGTFRLRRAAARACGAVGPDRRRRRAPRADPPGDREGAGRPGPGRRGAERLRRGARGPGDRGPRQRGRRDRVRTRGVPRDRGRPRRCRGGPWSRLWRPPRTWDTARCSRPCTATSVPSGCGGDSGRRPPRRSKPGWPTPTPATAGTRGRSTCSASTRARGETTSGPGAEARATLESLGVVVLPYGLDAVVG